MGVVARAAVVIAGLTVASLLTWLLERLLPTRNEYGPASVRTSKEEISLPAADRWLRALAPVMAVLGVVWGAIVIPFSPTLIGRDLGIGAFYFIVVLDFVVLGVALAGWGANTADGIEACYRIVAQLVAYVIPLGLAYVGVLMMARSLSTVAIVNAQSTLWYIVLQPLGFALYIVCGLTQSYRAPFLEPFAAGIGGGVLGTVGGRLAVLWHLALSGLLFLVAAMGAVLFLGGWHGPGLPGWLWMLLKTYAVMALMIGLGRRLRLRSTAQMLSLAWKGLIPLGLVNVLIVGGLILLGVSGT